MAATLPRMEVERLRRLHSVGILDTPADQTFDNLARLAAKVVRAPTALINFIDETRTWCKATWGGVRGTVERKRSLCGEALLTGKRLIIRNAQTDPRYQGHYDVAGEPKVAFYAGIVLNTADGVSLGTLCVTDRVERDLGPGDLEELEAIALQIVQLVEIHTLRAKVAEQQISIDKARDSRDQFLAMLAHELRAPLAPILTAVQILNRDDITVEQRLWSKKLIHRHVRYMSEIVDHLLSASLISTGVIDLQLEPISVNVLLREAYEMSETAITKRGHTYVAESSDEWVFADNTQAAVILSNLLANAAKYTPDNGHIDVHVSAEEDDIRIVVRDDGMGIDPADANEIFQVFGQSKQPLDRAMGGIGLGLALGRRLAEWQNGSLTAFSNGIGQGSEFTLTLKRAEPRLMTANAGHSASQETHRPLEMLIVEDNIDTADALALYYQLAGHHVRVAYNATDAVAMVVQRRPDVVLSDIGLPDTNGYALIRKLRSLNSLLGAAFVAISGYSTDADRKAARDAGFDAHFGKPVDFAQLDRFLSRLKGIDSTDGDVPRV